MPNAIKYETFYNRMSRCYYYKEEELYRKEERIILLNALKTYAEDPSRSYLDIVTQVYTSRERSGRKYVYADHRQFVKEKFIAAASNLSDFLERTKPTNILEYYIYQHKLWGRIGGIVQNQGLNIHFSFKNSVDTQKDIDFYNLNNYIYNKVKKTTNDCLIMSVPTDTYFKVLYNKNDYTMKRGFVSSITKSMNRRPGEYCLSCTRTCKPFYINGLTRLENSI